VRWNKKGITWDKNMEDEFWEFMLECYNLYQKMEEKVFPQVMTIIATPQ
jgi:hypothetical protein